jgi:Uma2 family endonuclease
VNTLKPERWDLDEFFAWSEKQEARYELVDGFPRLMTRAMRIHNAIAINILVALTARLRGRGCRPSNGDDSVETLPGQIRCPDAGIYCGG